jgi:hypothetical protein
MAARLARARLRPRSFLKEAREAGVSKQEAKLGGLEVSAVPVRLFAGADQKAGLDWAAARRGKKALLQPPRGPCDAGCAFR